MAPDQSHAFGPSPDEILRRLGGLPGACLMSEGGGQVWVSAAPTQRLTLPAGEDPWPALRAAYDATAPGGRWMVALAYEAGAARLPVPTRALAPGEPWGHLAYYPAAWVVDSAGGRWVGDPAHAAELAQACAAPARAAPPPQPVGLPRLLMDAETYRARVETLQAHIRAGEIYQGNLTSPVRAHWRGHPLALFEALCAPSPPPWRAFFDASPWVFASASPELLLSYDAETRRALSGPIKGTCPGAPGDAEADRLFQGLASSVKDRAEHVMIVDLIRNDLGQVCAPGSVRVEGLLQRLRLDRVQHLVSEVAGRLRQDLHPVDAWAALFPGGSVTGAPKIAAIQRLHALELAPRGIYCGALGRMSREGLALNLPIRTATLTPTDSEGWAVEYPAGGGVVADSTWEGELAELQLKAARFVDALGGEGLELGLEPAVDLGAPLGGDAAEVRRHPPGVGD